MSNRLFYKKQENAGVKREKSNPTLGWVNPRVGSEKSSTNGLLVKKATLGIP